MILPVSKEGLPTPKKNDGAERKPSRSFKETMKTPPPPLVQKMSPFDLPKQKSPRLPQKKKLSDSHAGQQREVPRDLNQTRACESQSIKAELAPGMDELLNQMEHYLHIESQNGISTIELEVNLSDPDSIFQGVLLTIDHYDTHPHSFNIRLSHSAQLAVDELAAHLPSLLKSLEAKLTDFQINLMPPSYRSQFEEKKVRTSPKSERLEKEKRPKIKEIPS